MRVVVRTVTVLCDTLIACSLSMKPEVNYKQAERQNCKDLIIINGSQPYKQYTHES